MDNRDMPVRTKEKQHECLSIIAQMVRFYADVSAESQRRAEKFKVWFYPTAFIGILMVLAFIWAASTSPDMVHTVIGSIAGIAAILMMVLSMWLGGVWDRYKTGATRHNARTIELMDMRAEIKSQPVGYAGVVDAWFFLKAQRLVIALTRELLSERGRYSDDFLDKARLNNLPKSERLSSTITDIASAVSAADMADDVAQSVAEGIHSVVSRLAD
jgi:hypothetical protein